MYKQFCNKADIINRYNRILHRLSIKVYMHIQQLTFQHF